MYQSMIRDVCVVLSCSAVTDSFVFVVQSLRVQLFVIPWAAAHQASVSFTISWSLLKVRSLELVMPSNHLLLRHHLLLPSSIFPSIRVFSNESLLHIRWPSYWSFSFSISPSNEHLDMTNLDLLKSRDITLPTKVHLVKAIVFPVVMYGCESWTIKKAEH